MAVDLEDYSLARVIKGVYDTTYTTVAVDEDGNIIGVFKGDYNNTLKTIKVDSSGRMLAIITDPEDVYGNAHMIGNAELAARLGSINTFDRRGDTIWMDDFEAVFLRWTPYTVGDNSECVLVADESFSGSQSCKLRTDINVNDYAEIRRSFALPVQTRIGFQFSVTANMGDNNLEIWNSIYTGTELYQAKTKYHYDTKTLSVYDHTAGWTSIATDRVLGAKPLFYSTIKLVVDYSTGKYVRLLFDEKTYDISAYTMPYTTPAASPSMTILIQLKNLDATGRQAWIDNVILTQNES